MIFIKSASPNSQNGRKCTILSRHNLITSPHLFLVPLKTTAYSTYFGEIINIKFKITSFGTILNHFFNIIHFYLLFFNLFHSLNNLSQLNGHTFKGDYNKLKELAKGNQHIIETIIEDCQQKNINVFLITTPCHSYYRENIDTNQYSIMQNTINDILNKYSDNNV